MKKGIIGLPTVFLILQAWKDIIRHSLYLLIQYNKSLGKYKIRINKILEKQQNILYAIGINENEGNSVNFIAADKAEQEFNKYITKQIYIQGDQVIEDDKAYLIDVKKQKAASRKKQKRIQIKEIKFRPVTEENDYQIKVNKIKSFLNDGNKAKITLRFRGREMAHQDIGLDLLKRVETDLETIASVEQFPTLEGRQLVMMMSPNRK